MNEKLKKTDLESMFNAILTLKTTEECFAFFEDLCTVPELKAMAQRYQVAQMLNEQMVYNEIVKKTGASTATISRVNRALHYGSDGYKSVFERAEQQK